ncbi:MAG: class I SAM-dependent methyltransferase [Pseudomonadota bacterium]|nr:class I SAM-dependent methyltransferase [Pseudomonadota bacterium]
MPSTVKAHYDNLLAEHYDWMFGVPFDAKVAEQKTLLQELVDTTLLRGGLAADLGCGSGFQSVALADLGCQVLAIDTSEKLLKELLARIASRDITTKHADLLGLDCIVDPASVSIVVCMGDTLPHLRSRDEVSELFRSVHRALKPGGQFVVTYRDLSVGELQGLDRFIPIRGDDRRVMTCFLEYEGPGSVVVHDLVNIRDGNGNWTLRKSSYRKLRLPAYWVFKELDAAGLSVVTTRPGQLITIAATKPTGR